MRKVLVLLLVIGLMIAAAACGTEASTGESGTSGDGSTDADLGGMKSVATATGGKLEVTPHQSKRVEKVISYGSELSPEAYGIQLTIRNAGSDAYEDVITDCVALVDTKDKTHKAEPYMFQQDGSDMPDLLVSVKIAAGEEITGWVYFPMTADGQARTLKFTANSGAGPETAKWSLEQ